jgi:catechol 2,3-dioxygenase-like lactoylglutathione lyase family enzyme
MRPRAVVWRPGISRSVALEVADMLASATVTTILPAVDLDRARDFYEHKLGLTPVGAQPDGKFVYQCGGTLLALFPRGAPTKADHTAVSFEVADIVSEIAALEEKGVTFNDYDLPGLKTVAHVCVLGAEKAAWFNDTEGNILCLHEKL